MQWMVPKLDPYLGTKFGFFIPIVILVLVSVPPVSDSMSRRRPDKNNGGMIGC